MKKRLNFYLLSLFAFIVIITNSQNIKAEDVCAPTLIPPSQASEICQKVCVDAQPTAQFNGQWNNTSPTCHWVWSGQYGVCGCNPLPCQCKEGSQTVCDESITPGGANTCSSNCNCTQGRTCNSEGWCQGTPGLPCCSQCRPQYQTCMTLCNGVPIQERGDCQSMCGGDLNTCTSDCQPCSESGKEIKKSKTKDRSKGVIPSKPSLPPKVKEAPSESHPVSPKKKEVPKAKEVPSEAPRVSPKAKEASSEAPPGSLKSKEGPSESHPVSPKVKEEASEIPLGGPKAKEKQKGIITPFPQTEEGNKPG